jgi:hypothetical protein
MHVAEALDLDADPNLEWKNSAVSKLAPTTFPLAYAIWPYSNSGFSKEIYAAYCGSGSETLLE